MTLLEWIKEVNIKVNKLLTGIKEVTIKVNSEKGRFPLLDMVVKVPFSFYKSL